MFNLKNENLNLMVSIWHMRKSSQIVIWCFEYFVEECPTHLRCSIRILQVRNMLVQNDKIQLPIVYFFVLRM
jgi:hypothetical protein